MGCVLFFDGVGFIGNFFGIEVNMCRVVKE